MIRVSQRTLYLVDIDLHRQLGVPYKPLENTTLNEKFNVLTTADVPSTYPTLQGFVIGIGGNPIMENVENFPYNEHSPVDGALFEHIPFVMCPVDQDLTDEERESYRLRTIETINNTQYVCYYMKKLTGYELTSQFSTVKTVMDGESVSVPTIAAFDNNITTILNPIPRTRLLKYDTADKTEYVAKLAKVYFVLTENDNAKLRKVFEYKGLPNRKITELGLCTGIETTTDYGKETLITQIGYHIPMNFELIQEVGKGGVINKILELGGMEPYIY